MLRNSIFLPKNSRSVHVNALAWKPLLASPYKQERVQIPLRGRRGLSQPSSCSPSSSLTPNISQERLGLAALTNNPVISVAYPREVYFSFTVGLQGSSISPWTWVEEGFILMLASHYCLGWGKCRQQIIHWLSTSTWKWHTSLLLTLHLLVK